LTHLHYITFTKCYVLFGKFIAYVRPAGVSSVGQSMLSFIATQH